MQKSLLPLRTMRAGTRIGIGIRIKTGINLVLLICMYTYICNDHILYTYLYSRIYIHVYICVFRDRHEGDGEGEGFDLLNEGEGKNSIVDDEYSLVESNTINLNSEKVKEALAVALGGLIIDVTQSDGKKGDEGETVSVGDDSPVSDESKTRTETAALGFSLRSLDEKNNSTTAPGSGWGLVDADGSDEGFGVVGLEMGAVDHLGVRVTGEGDLKSNEVKNKAQINIENESKINSVVNDRMGDVRLVESGIREGSDVVETGPSHGGTKKVL
jgi:hypothetical protein